MENLPLSESAKRFIDYAIDTVTAMDGAPEHTATAQDVVIAKIDTLRTYLNELEKSYLETVPGNGSAPIDPEYIAAAGHS